MATNLQLAEFVDSLNNQEPMKFRHLYAIIKERAENALPVWIHQRVVYSKKHSLDLSDKPKMYELFRLFVEAKGKGYDKDDLIRVLYNPECRFVSMRQKDSYGRNLTKLISRARLLMEEHFTDLNDIHWFPNDRNRGRWSFFQDKI